METAMLSLHFSLAGSRFRPQCNGEAPGWQLQGDLAIQQGTADLNDAIPVPWESSFRPFRRVLKRHLLPLPQ